jgi:hypothetical protein
MQAYKQSSSQTGLELWPKFEEAGDEVLEGNPQQSGRVDWGNIEGPVAVGIWECTPGTARGTYAFSELCMIRQGRVTITDGNGKQTTFGPGDSFFVAQGETLTWDIHETVQKTFLIHVDVGS